MQFSIEPLGKRLLDDAVFFRIKEQLLISLRVFHISLLCSCVKDTGENTSLINLPIIAFSSFFDFCILDSKDTILEDCRLMRSTLTDCTGIDEEIQTQLEEIEVVTELTKRCIAENSQTAQNQEEYAARYNGFVERYEKAKTQVEGLHSIKNARQAQADAIGAFMFEVQELDTLSEFDEKLWLTVIDTVTVHADGRMTFKFQGGTVIDA